MAVGRNGNVEGPDQDPRGQPHADAPRPVAAPGGFLMAPWLAETSERLFSEFDGQVPLLTILMVLRDCAEQLRGEPAAAFPELAERLARARLYNGRRRNQL